MNHESHPIAEGALWNALVRTADAALSAGALRPIATEQVRIEDGGVGFWVRVAANLQRKAEDQAQQRQNEAPVNPFLPPEPELWVGDLGATHRAVLNKFNVLEHHLLLVTRAFQHQEQLLDLDDFRVLCRGLREFDALGFYNGGEIAGASQMHKHLQLVPLPLSGDEAGAPMARIFGETPEGFLLGRLPALPFDHAFAPLPPELWTNLEQAAEHCFDRYQELLGFLGIGEMECAGEMRQTRPYNLLVTRDWMLAVPRSEECFGPVSVNGLGFAGSLFVKRPEDLEAIRREGPMRILCRVSRSD